MLNNPFFLILLGSFLPNNLLILVWYKIFPKRRVIRKYQTNGFARFAQRFGDAFGSAPNFILWFILLLVWIGVGHLFHWDNTWQLLANTPTTWLELFAAITIQYVGNRIERRQEVHEAHMLKVLEHLERSEAETSAKQNMILANQALILERLAAREPVV